MSDYTRRETASADECKHKIKTPFAKIIVGGTPEKPCYAILYFDTADGKCHIGFGSYRLDYVFQWLAEEFEIAEPCANMEPVRHGRWIKDGNFLICLVCENEINIKNSLGADNHKNYCPSCGAKMDLEEKENEQ